MPTAALIIPQSLKNHRRTAQKLSVNLEFNAIYSAFNSCRADRNTSPALLTFSSSKPGDVRAACCDAAF